MKNFDEEPDRGQDADGVVGVEIAGDSAAIRQMYETLMSAAVGDVTERFRAAKVYAPATAGLSKMIGESLKALDVGREARMAAVRAVEMPKVDFKHLTALTPIKPLEFERIRSVEDRRLEELTNVMSELVELGEKETAPLLAMDAVAEARHTEAERRADERAKRADNRSMWNICSAAIASAGATVGLFEFIIR